ncbi:MAG TPA: DUF58 domain-containing protein [Mycobacteriales bacterium]|nr:DUF58 domain-containing protein [Mycobacteriales bacterium]
MRTALSGLTTRGRCLLAAGVSLAVCATLLGQRDLLRAAVFLLGLPLAAVVLVSRTRYRLACGRQLDPPRVEAGRTATVRLRLDNVSRLPSGVLLMEDALPFSLGGRPRFVLDRVEPKGVREVSYPVRSEVRGRFRVGPLSVRLTDPFGLVELTRSFSAADDLVVTPVVSPLPAVRLGGDWSSGGEAAARAVSAAGQDDAATREYREGDDLRKVHWRSTARVGELMVRREEQPFTSRGTLLLDARLVAHRGQGPGSSLEWAVSAVASIGVALLQQSYALRLLDDGGTDLVPTGAALTEGPLLDALAGVQPSLRASLDGATEQLRRGGVDGVLVAVLGTLQAAEAEQLSRLRHGAGTCVAVLVDSTTWGGPRAGAAGIAHEAAATLLRRTGWRVLTVAHGTTLASVWPEASTRSGRGADVAAGGLR